MKFKVEPTVVVQDLESSEDPITPADIQCLDKALEELNDLLVLRENIEKYGITEQVMDLVGGTLESMNIRIDNADACLEGIGESISNGVKTVFAFMRKIIDKIIQFITDCLNRRDAQERKELEQKLKELEKVPVEERISCTGIPEKQPLQHCISIGKTCNSTHNWTGENSRNVDEMLRMGKDVFQRTDSGSIEFLESFTKSISEEDTRNFKEKKYSDFWDVAATCGGATGALSTIKKGLETTQKEIDTLEKKTHALIAKDPDAKKMLDDKRVYLVGLGKLSSVLARIDRSDLLYEKKVFAARNNPKDKMIADGVEKRLNENK